MRIFLFLHILFLTQLAFAEEQVGVIIPLTGDFTRYGEKIRNGLEKEKSEEIKYIYEDEGCNAQKAITAYKKLSHIDNIKLFLGPWCGSPQTSVAPLLPGSKQMAILGSSAPERVYTESQGRMFSVQHSIEQESRFNAERAYEMGARKVVILFLDNDFSRAHEKAFRDEFKGEVLETLTYSTPDASALKSLALKIKKLSPDTLYIPDAFPLMHGILKELHTLHLNDLKIFSVYSAESEDVLTAISSFGEGLYYSYPVIGEQEALKYFPAKAAQIVRAVVSKCGSKDIECAISFLKSKYAFNKNGVLEGELGLKTVKDGKFKWLSLD